MHQTASGSTQLQRGVNNVWSHQPQGLPPRMAHRLPALGRGLNALLSRPSLTAGTGCHLSSRLTYTAHSRRGLTTTHAQADYQGQGTGAPRVVILGGGFGGLYTAVRLTALFWPQGHKPSVTLVDQSHRFVFKPLLYELLNGGASESEVAPDYSQLLAPYPVRFIQAKVVGAQPTEAHPGGGSTGGGTVTLDGGQSLEYDWLIVALGAQADARGVPGVAELAVPFNTLEDALRVERALGAIEEAASQGGAPGARHVMVVGAGYAGVELCAVIGERLRTRGLSGAVRVSMVTPGGTILEGSPQGQREAAEETLRGLGVDIVTGTRVRSLEPAPADSGALPSAVLVNLDTAPLRIPGFQDVAASAAESVAAAARAVSGGAAVAAEAATTAASALRDPDGETASFASAVKDLAGGALSSISEASASQEHVPAAVSSSSSASSSDSAAGGAAGASHSIAAEPAGPRKVPADLVLWTAGSAPATKAARQGFPFPTNARGSVQTEASLRVRSHARVFALGDVCVADQEGYVQDSASTQTYTGTSGSSSSGSNSSSTAGGSSFPATAQVAFQQADYVAWNLWAAMNNRPLLPFKYQHLGSMMALGQFNAAVALPVPMPQPLQATLQASPLGPVLSQLGIKLSDSGSEGVTVEGPLAALMRRAAYLYRQPTSEQRISVATQWLQQAAGLAAGALSGLPTPAPPGSSSK